MIWLKMPLFMFLRDLNITFLNQIKIFLKKIHVCFMSKQIISVTNQVIPTTEIGIFGYVIPYNAIWTGPISFKQR